MKRLSLIACAAFALSGCALLEGKPTQVDQAKLDSVDSVAIASLIVANHTDKNGSLMALAQVGAWGQELAPRIERRITPILLELLEPRFSVVPAEKVVASRAYQDLKTYSTITAMGGLRRVDIANEQAAMPAVAADLDVDALLMASYKTGVRLQNGKTFGECWGRYVVIDRTGEQIWFQVIGASVEPTYSASGRIAGSFGKIDFESMGGAIRNACAQSTDGFYESFSRATPLE